MNNNTNLVLGIIIALIIGVGAGYSFGKGINDNSVNSKELQDSVTMMNEQAVTIQKMAEMMKSSGTMMREVGARYNENEAVMKGKDLEVMGEKYMMEVMKSAESHSLMMQMQM